MIEATESTENREGAGFYLWIMLAILVLIIAGASYKFLNSEPVKKVFQGASNQNTTDLESIGLNSNSLYVFIQSINLTDLPAEYRSVIQELQVLSEAEINILLSDGAAEITAEGLSDVEEHIDDAEAIKESFRDLAGNLRGITDDLDDTLDAALDELDKTGTLSKETRSKILGDANAAREEASPEQNTAIEDLTQLQMGIGTFTGIVEMITGRTYAEVLQAFQKREASDDGQAAIDFFENRNISLNIKQLLKYDPPGYDPKKPFIDNTGRNV